VELASTDCDRRCPCVCALPAPASDLAFVSARTSSVDADETIDPPVAAAPAAFVVVVLDFFLFTDPEPDATAAGAGAPPSLVQPLSASPSFSPLFDFVLLFFSLPPAPTSLIAVLLTVPLPIIG
jgi:hypothetical protein